MSAKRKNAKVQKEAAHVEVGMPTVQKGTTDSGKWWVIAILAFTALLYGRALTNGFTFNDDDFYILKNPFIRNFSWKGVLAIFTSFNNYNYHPLTTLTDLFIYHWFGLDPIPYHLLNVLLHITNVWLVFVLAEKLSGKKVTAAVVAILFAVHPLHVESVAWISERKDVLYTLFYLASLITYLRYVESGKQSKFYILALVLFVGALFSKSAAITLPVLLIAIDVYRKRKMTAGPLLEKVPFLTLSLVFGVLAIKSQSSGGAVSDLSLYFSFINRIFLVTSGLSFYIIQLIIPHNQCALHFYPDITANILPWYYYLSLPFLMALAWLISRRSPYKRDILFGAAFFLVTISVMLQIIPLGAAFAAERYTYVPYIGLFYVAGQWVSDNCEQYRRLIVPAFSAVIIIFSILTWIRIGTWQDTDTLFTDIVDKNPGNWRDGMVYNSWGDFEEYSGDNNSALQKYNEAIRLFPRYALGHYNRGRIYQAVGNKKAALADFDEAVKLTPKNALYYNSRGWAYYQAGGKKEALLDYDKAISIDPHLAEAYNNRGWAYYESGDIKSSMNDFSKAIACAPTFVKPFYNKALIEINSGNLAAAIEDYNAVLKINHNDSMAYFDRGIVRLNQRDTAGACEDWNKAVELGYRNAQREIQQFCRH